MDVRVLYLESSASWRTAAERLRQALALHGSPDTPIKSVQVGVDAVSDDPVWGGSPTILVDDQDLFPIAAIPVCPGMPAVLDPVRYGGITHR